jgi:excisionase family DNA binding protein
MPEFEHAPAEEMGTEVDSTETSGLLNVREAARFLRVSETSIRRWSDSGKLKCYRVGVARHRRFSMRDLKEFLQSGDASDAE